MTPRAAVIGGGFGARIVAGCYREAGMMVEVVAPRDRDAVRAACRAPVVLVSVHSPPFLHAEHVALAIEHGRNVLCDKPFGMSAAQSREMLALAEAAGVLHFLNFEFRCDPARLVLKRLIDEGTIGTVRHIHWTAFTAGSRVPLRPYGWLFDQARGGGWLGAFGSHVLDALRWMVGEVTVIDGNLRTDVAERPDADGVVHACTADDAFVARLRFASGATAIVDSTFAAPANLPPRITVVGSDGMIEAVGSTRVRVTGSAADRVIELPPFDGDGHLPSMRPWAIAVRGALAERRQIAPNFRDGLACAELMDRLRGAA